MTREEAYNRFDAIIAKHELVMFMTHLDYDALRMAKEALEQEPKTDVLDKIRAEIDAHRETLKTMADDDWYAGKIRGYDCAIEIIDKYKALEQEPCEDAISRQQVKSDYADWFCCSECGSIELKRSKYCPNCGAKMQ